MALQKLNTDVVHGVSSGNLDVDAISLDNSVHVPCKGQCSGAGPSWGHIAVSGLQAYEISLIKTLQASMATPGMTKYWRT